MVFLTLFIFKFIYETKFLLVYQIFPTENEIQNLIEHYEKSEESHFCRLKIEINGDVAYSPIIPDNHCKFSNSIEVDENEDFQRRFCVFGQSIAWITMKKAVCNRNVNAEFSKVFE